jgi:hypothetical protein
MTKFRSDASSRISDVSLTLQSIAKALGGKVNGDQVLAPGPGHSPEDRSLSVKIDSEAPDGFVVFSFASDDPIICRDHVRQRCGLPAFEPHSRRPRTSSAELRQLMQSVVATLEEERPPSGLLTDTYCYTDENGAELYQVLRYMPKTFRYRRPNGNGGFIWGIGNARRVPYRLPDILKYPDATTFICEGEKDANRVAELELTATTAASGEWTPGMIQLLAGRDILILEDNDKTGRQKASDLATKLHGIAKSVRIVALPGLAEGGDVSDYLDAGHSKDELIEQCFATPVIETVKPAATESPTPTTRFKLVRFGQIALQTALTYLVAGLIPRVGLIVIWGPPKCGKSFWIFDLVMHIALGWTYRGRKVRAGSVVYLALEGHAGFHRRVAAFRKSHSVVDAPFHLITTRTDLVRDHLVLIAAIRAESVTPAAVVVDTLNRSLPGSESKDEDMGAYVKAADAIREAFDCAVIIIHHCGVAGDRPRGHTSLAGAVDAQLAVRRDMAHNVVVEVEWMKDGDTEGDVIISKLERVPLGLDDDKNELSSCVVMPSEAPAADATGDSLTKNQRTMFSILYEAGPRGLTLAEWNKTTRDAGIGVRRKADLVDLRTALHAKGLIYESNDRWIARRE